MLILLLMLLIMPFEFSPYLHISDSFLGVVPEFTVVKLLGLLGLALSAVGALTGEVRLRLLDSAQARAFLVFFAIASAASVANGVGTLAASRLLSVGLFLPLVLRAVRTERNLQVALKTAAVSLIVVFPYAWRQITRFGGRYGVGLYEPNYLALALVLVLPLAWVSFRHAPSTHTRAGWFLGTLVLLVSLIWTGSRGGLVGLVAVMVWGWFTLARRRGLGVVGGIAMVTVFLAVPTTMRDRAFASGTAQDSGIEASNRARVDTLRAGVAMIEESPLLGIGLGGFKAETREYDVETEVMAHNTYVELAAELGIPALVAFCAILLATWRSLGRSRRSAEAAGNPLFADMATALQVGLVGYATSAVFLSAQFEKFLWVAIFLSICMERVLAEAPAAAAGADDAR